MSGLFDGVQRVFRKNYGLDTHVRSKEMNAFTRPLNSILIGEIDTVCAEPLFRQTAVNVKNSTGGSMSNVGYPNAGVDQLTGNVHGLYQGAIKGQMVAVGFVGGNRHSPIVLNSFPYQGTSNYTKEINYFLPMSKKLIDSSDVLMGHFSGSKIHIYTGLTSGMIPGTIGISAITNLQLSSVLKTTIDAGLSFSLVEKMGATFGMEGMLFSMSNKTQDFGALMKEFLTIFRDMTTFGSAPSHQLTPDVVIKINALMTKFGGLIKGAL